MESIRKQEKGSGAEDKAAQRCAMLGAVEDVDATRKQLEPDSAEKFPRRHEKAKSSAGFTAQHRARVKGSLASNNQQVDQAKLEPDHEIMSTIAPLPSGLHNQEYIHQQPGAFRHFGDKAGSSDDDMSDVENSDHINKRVSEQIVLQAHLPNSRNNNELIPTAVIEGTHEPEVPKTVQKRHWIVCGGFIVLFAMVGAVVGIFFRRNNSGDTISPTAGPTAAPTPEEYVNSAIYEFLETSAGGPFEDDSAHAMAANWLLYDDPLRIKDKSDDLVQRFALVSFYFSTTQNGARPWKRCNPPIQGEEEDCVLEEMRWLTGTNVCQWYRIHCDEDNKVVHALEQRANNLSGPIPEAIGLLKYLRWLDLFGNKLTGTIPEAIYDLQDLITIQLFGNPSITGTISSKVGKLTGLDRLQLGQCSLTGTIPSEVGLLHKLTLLSFHENAAMSGTIPVEVYSLSKLTALDLSLNAFTGTISPKVENLAELSLFLTVRNQLTGRLPTELGSIMSMTIIQVLGNDLSGAIPSEIGSLSLLDNFDFGMNPNINGTFPDELYGLSSLRSLSFWNTSIQGTISTLIGKLTTLSFLAMDATDMTGTMPSEFGLATDLSMMWMQRSRIGGELPTELGQLRKVSLLVLGKNQFTGTIPSEFGLMSALEVLYLGYNRIGGTIPEEIYGIQSLRILDLESMGLIGTLSSNIGMLTNLSGLSVRNNSLTGLVPHEIANIPLTDALHLNSTKLEGSIPPKICESPPVMLVADCLPIADPPMPCECCTICCDRSTRQCQVQ